MNPSPLVSIIMPAFNAAAYIKEAVLSVRNQTYTNWELFIIDDSSNDETRKIAKTFALKDERITLIVNQFNLGAGIARNRGIKVAKGDFIAFLDADDLWKPEKLFRQLQFMEKNQVLISYSSYELITQSGNKTGEIIEALPELSYSKLLKANYVGNLTGIYNAQKLGKIYAPEIRKRQDWALWLEAVKKGGPARGISEVLAQYRLHKDSISTNKWAMLRYNFNIYNQVLNYSFLASLYKMSIFLKEQIFIKSQQRKKLE